MCQAKELVVWGTRKGSNTSDMRVKLILKLTCGAHPRKK